MRRSGRTFRGITRALHDASEGKKIAYLTMNEVMTKYCFSLAVNIVGLIGIEPSKQYEIEFPNGGILIFTHRNVNDEGKKKMVNGVDYFVDDLDYSY